MNWVIAGLYFIGVIVFFWSLLWNAPIIEDEENE